MNWHSAYHGLVRATIMTTEDHSSAAWHRARLLQIDVDSSSRTRVVLDSDSDDVVPAPPIVLQASAPGLPSATISVPTSADPADGVLEVAARSAGKRVSID